MLTVDLDLRTDVPDTLDIDEAFVSRILVAAAQHQGIEGEVSVSVVDDEEIHELNRTWRNVDRPTDVLSFALTEGDEDEVAFLDETAPETMLGDIIISLPTAIRQAESYGHSVAREFGFLLVHGFLHLIGFDHDTADKEAEMFGLQETILDEVGLSRPS
jgi:probable rRNA maturation factor